MSEWDWRKPKQDALKILGNKGKVPDVPDSVEKSAEQFEKAIGAFLKAVADLEEKILTMENANDAQKNALKQFANKMDKDNLGLDPKSKEDGAKITKAQKLLAGSLQDCIRGLEGNDKKLDELDKLLAQLAKNSPRES